MKKSTLVLICITVLMLFITGVGAYLTLKTDGHAKTAYIYQGEKLLYEIDLEKVRESYTVTVSGDNGKENVIEIRQGKIGVVSASCPDKLCIKKGFVGDSLLPVVCLPNDVMIVVESEEGSVDAQI